MSLKYAYDIDSIDNRNAEFIDKIVGLADGFLVDYHNIKLRGLERVSPGAGIYVGNHSSAGYAPDILHFLSEIYRKLGIDEIPYGMMHEMTIRIPMLHQFFIPLGAVRASHENAHRLLERGNKILVYPGGDLDAYRPYRHRDRIVFGGRAGYIRLAIAENVPIYPLVTAGAHTMFIIIDDMRWLARMLPKFFRAKVWPLSVSFPWGITLGPMLIPPMAFPMNILMEILEPVCFDRHGKKAASDEAYVRSCADKVESDMQKTLNRLSQELTNSI